MKRFLYYNHDSVNSLLAQIGQGLLLKAGSENEEATTSSTTNSIASNLTGDLGAKVFGIGATVKGELQGTNTDEEVASSMIRNVQEKALHDYALEKVLENLTSNGMIHNNSPQIGDFILMEKTPTFLDFKYFERLFSEDGAAQFNIDQTQKKLKDVKKQVPNGQKMPPEMKLKIKEIEEQIKSQTEERKDTAKMLDVIKSTLPYDRFMLANPLLIPLDDNNLRDNPDIISFKYGGNVTIFGYVTNIISSEEPENPPDNVFAPFYKTVNQLMLNFAKGTNRLYIIHPIALYY